MITSSILLLTFAAADPNSAGDRLLAALEDELARSKSRLSLAPARAAPYYIGYTVRQSSSFNVSASFGALTNEGSGRWRSFSLDVRVGDYALDNTNFVDDQRGAYEPGTTISTDDDYDAIRNAIWIATDRAYKRAIEQRERKLAYLQATDVRDRPDDFSREAPIVRLDKPSELEVDRAGAKKLVRTLSSIFRSYPKILVSSVSFAASADGRWFVNSEGSRVRTSAREVRLVAVAGAVSNDGMRSIDYEILDAGEGVLSGVATSALEGKVRALAERVAKLADAPLVERYRGPVIFEGDASAELFFQTVGWHATAPREQLGERGVHGSQYPMRDELGRRVLPPFISVVDDPTVRELGGAPILGGYDIDDDGVPAQRVTLIDRGVLKAFCMSRVPTRDFKKSNGHSRQGWGSFGTIFVTTEKSSTAAELKKGLLDIGKTEELEHVYVIRKLSTWQPYALADWAGTWPTQRASARASEVALSAPALVYRVSVADGSETLVRGAVFGSLTFRLLRDIQATGDDGRARGVMYSDLHSIVSPSVLVREVEIERWSGETEKPPLTSHPFFEAKASPPKPR